MIVNSEGIILRTVRYAESSVILDILSPDEGVESYIISGIRPGKTGSKASVVRPPNLVEFTAYVSSKGRLRRLKDVQFGYIYQSIPFDVIKGTVALFLIEVLRNCLQSGDEMKDLYQFAREQFIALDESSKVGLFHHLFLVDLTTLLGIQITNNYDESNLFFNLKEGVFGHRPKDHRFVMNEETSANLASLLKRKDDISIARKAKKELILKLIEFYRYHIPGFGPLRSLEVLQSLYES